MEYRKFKPFKTISSLTLGGGGIGNVWGETSREEAIETVNLAYDSGITHFDVAPMYGKGEAERVLGEAFKDKNIENINITTKCQLGNPKDSEVYDILNNSLSRSLETMNLEKVNLFLLHSQLIEDNFKFFKYDETRKKSGTTLSCYFNAVIPAFEKLKKEGKIDHWGIGLGQEEALIKAINFSSPPNAMQCAVNILNSIGAIGYVSEKNDPNRILKECQSKNIPILAIRAVQAGALTNSMDRVPHISGFDIEDFKDFKKALPFRKFAEKMNESPSSLAHRYALSQDKVGSVILGVKNRKELIECIKAEEDGILDKETLVNLDKLFKNVK